MGHVDVAGVRYELPDGRVLLDDVSFRVGEGAKVALVGANGAGKTTLLRIITGDLVPHAGVVTRSGGLGVMRQMVNAGLGAEPTVADLLLSVSPATDPRGRTRGRPLRAGAHGDRRREDPDAVRRGAVGVRRRRRLRPRGHLGRLHGRGPRRPLRPGQVPRAPHAQRRRAEAAGPGVPAARAGRGAAARRAGQLPGRARARSGSSSGSASPTRRSCSSATTASCWPTPRPAWSRSSSAPRATSCGPTPAASRRTTRRARTGSSASRRCGAAGTRSTPRSRRSCSGSRSRLSTTTAWPASTRRPRPGSACSRRRARRSSSRASSRSRCGSRAAAPASARSSARTSS